MVGGSFRQCQNSLHDGNGSSVLIGCEYRTYEGTFMSLYNSYCGRFSLPVTTVFPPSPRLLQVGSMPQLALLHMQLLTYLEVPLICFASVKRP